MEQQSTSIQKKLMKLIMLICGSVLFVACASFIIYEFFTFRNSSRWELATLGAVTANNLTSSIAFKDNEDAQEILQSLRAQKHIVAAVLYDENGNLFATYPLNPGKEHLPESMQPDGYTIGKNFIRGFQPVVQGSKRLGTLYLKADLKGVYSRFQLYGLIALGFFLLAFLLTYLLSRRLQHSVTQPILHLADIARQISKRKDYAVRADKKSADELGILTDAFNHMLTQIETQNSQIKKLNTNLEERIKMRTWELQEANNALTEQNEFIQTIIDASIDLIVVFDKDLNYLILNKQAAESFNLNREEIIGKNILDVFPNLRNQPTILNMQKALQGEFIHLEAYKSSINEAYFENYFIPLRDKDENVDRVLLIAHDITNIMMANEKLQQLNSELEKSNRDLEQFAYVASHDLQEPLRKITTFSDLSEKNINNPEVQKRYLQKISSSSRRMTELIKAVLNYSRLSRGGSEYTNVDLNAIVEQLKSDLELVIEEKEAVIKTGKLPVIYGIPLQMSQLFQNLLTNALKFSDRPPVIEINTSLVSPDDAETLLHAGKEFIKITFSDNGIGFEQEYADRVFSIFQRLHTTDKYAGTGIGLALCKKIVENHEGYIKVKSKPGAGTTFFIYLPLNRVVKEMDQATNVKETITTDLTLVKNS